MNERSHLSRQIGLLFAVAVIALVSRWLQSGPTDAVPIAEADAPTGAGGSSLRIEEAAAAPAAVVAPAVAPRPRAGDRTEARQPVRLGPPAPAEPPIALSDARPISAVLCHALDERLRALAQQAAGKLPRHEQRKLRAERQRARELLQGLRCRADGDRYWF